MLIHSRAGDVFAQRLTAAWARTDALFDLVGPAAMLTRPISLRHPFIFYVGHLSAFAWNHIGRGVLGRPSFHPHFDDVFDRGIDPDVDNPEICHAHPDVPGEWPALDEVIAYRDRVREIMIDSLPEIEAQAPTSVMARH